MELAWYELPGLSFHNRVLLNNRSPGEGKWVHGMCSWCVEIAIALLDPSYSRDDLVVDTHRPNKCGICGQEFS